MSIELEFINLVIRKSTLEEKYQGGLAQFKLDLPNRSLREDEQLVRFGCMNWRDLEHFTDIIISKGLEYQEKVTTDFVVISALKGPLWHVEWLGYESTSCFALA